MNIVCNNHLNFIKTCRRRRLLHGIIRKEDPVNGLTKGDLYPGQTDFSVEHKSGENPVSFWHTGHQHLQGRGHAEYRQGTGKEPGKERGLYRGLVFLYRLKSDSHRCGVSGNVPTGGWGKGSFPAFLRGGITERISFVPSGTALRKRPAGRILIESQKAFVPAHGFSFA